MKVCLAENIRMLRKERGLTQEQLAEAMGITVGTVSKWETGSCVPDVSLMMELAEFFETSVDVLLGYERQSMALEDRLERLKSLRMSKHYDEAFREGEQALQKYPNSFRVVYECAQLYQVAGIELGDGQMLRRCRELFRRSLGLLDQNRDPEIGEISIRNDIAAAYLSQGEREKGIALLKENNTAGINNAAIGNELAMDEATSEEALTYLSKALLDAGSQVVRFAIGYSNACLRLGRAGDALAFTQLLLQFQEGLKKPGKTSYLDKVSVMLLTLCAFSSMDMGDAAQAEEYLKQARDQAARFDAAPNCTMEHVRFIIPSQNAAYDDFGATAADGIRRLLEENREEYPGLLEQWEKLCREGN